MLRNSEMAQAADIVNKVHAVSCDIVTSEGGRVPVEFSSEEIGKLAELEHERWEAERRADGWTLGPTKDPVAKHSPYLVPWRDLAEEVRDRGPRYRAQNSSISGPGSSLGRAYCSTQLNLLRIISSLDADRENRHRGIDFLMDGEDTCGTALPWASCCCHFVKFLERAALVMLNGAPVRNDDARSLRPAWLPSGSSNAWVEFAD